MFYTGFSRSCKAWKSHGIVKWLFPGLERSLKKIKPQNFWKSHGNLLYSYVNLHSLIQRIKICRYIYSLNQTIVSHLCHLSFILMYTPRFHMFGHANFMERSWKSIGQHVHDPCLLYELCFTLPPLSLFTQVWSSSTKPTSGRCTRTSCSAWLRTSPGSGPTWRFWWPAPLWTRSASPASSTTRPSSGSPAGGSRWTSSTLK